MKIEKIKNYNQVILATGGTIIILISVLVGIYLLVDIFKFRIKSHENKDYGIMAPSEADRLNADSLRKQIISFNNLILVDTAERIYLLPVKQENIPEGESTKISLDLANRYSRYGDNSYDAPRTYSNLVVFRSKENDSEIVCSERISISSYEHIKQGNKLYLLIIGTDIDSNKDGYLNSNDLQKLHIYNVFEKKLSKIELKENYTTLDIVKHKFNHTYEVMVKFAPDRNRNGVFDSVLEPTIYFKLDLANNALISMVDSAQIDSLQQLLEGR